MIPALDHRDLLAAMKRTRSINEKVVANGRPFNYETHRAAARIAVLDGFITGIEAGDYDLEGSFL